MWTQLPILLKRYTVPGLVVGCSATDSLLSSTLECYYHGTDCFAILMNYTKRTYIANVEHPAWFDVQQLRDDDPPTSRFPPRTRISTMVREMMVERWNVSVAYDRFYESCAPSYCSYTTAIRTRPIEVATELVSLVGGLVLLLRMIVPRLAAYVLRLMANTDKKQPSRRGQSILLVSVSTELGCLVCRSLLELRLAEGDSVQGLRAASNQVSKIEHLSAARFRK